MKRLEFIKVYDGVLSPEMCEILINLFNTNKQHHVRVNNDYKPHFTEFNLSEHYGEYHNIMTRYVLDVVERYSNDCVPYSQFWPNQPTILEGMRIKRYNEDTGERFDRHVDVANSTSAMRYLSLLFYLNDGFEGGGTHFLPDYNITPSAGSVLVFPPTWQYPHSGLEVISGTKYIMSTYLHYYDPGQRTNNS